MTRVRRTEVKCFRAETVEFERKERESDTCFLSSLRADCAVAAAFRLSRGEAEKYFEAERVFINGRLCPRSSKELNEGDRVTVRGKGRFFLAEISGESRKGRLRCRIERD